jgi:hypothetical protein
MLEHCRYLSVLLRLLSHAFDATAVAGALNVIAPPSRINGATQAFLNIFISHSVLTVGPKPAGSIMRRY